MSSIEVDRHGASPGTRSIVARGWTEAQCRAYAIADNRLTDSSRWNEELPQLELGDLRAVGFDLTLTGFATRRSPSFAKRGASDRRPASGPKSLCSSGQRDGQACRPSIAPTVRRLSQSSGVAATWPLAVRTQQPR